MTSKIEPTNEESCFLGISFFKIGDHVQAVESFTTILENDSNNYNAQIGLGLALGGLGDNAHAVESFKRAMEIDSEVPMVEAYCHLGSALLVLGCPKDGLKILKDGLAVFPKNIHLYFSLGLFLEDKGNIPRPLNIFN